ncbi:TatD family hydrolase, partial [Candidatus Saccharibacteria bacterium]|nr:TatD family hydrolase [Candidatus Saccharibacteria bacterium]
MLIDTHCHIHEADFPLPISEVLERAKYADVTKLICIGTTEISSKEAIIFASEHEHVWASIGVHPHDTKNGYDEVEKLAGTSEKIVAVGEIGLDYFYNHSSREVQIKALKEQIKVA